MAEQTVTEAGRSAVRVRGARGRLRAAWSRPAAPHVAILSGYLAAGIAVTWPRAAYLVQGRLPSYLDVTSYIWDLWWVEHQVSHPGNPFLTHDMAAPVLRRVDTDKPWPCGLRGRGIWQLGRIGDVVGRGARSLVLGQVTRQRIQGTHGAERVRAGPFSACR